MPYVTPNINGKYEKHTKLKIKYAFAFTLNHANATDSPLIYLMENTHEVLHVIPKKYIMRKNNC